MADYVIKVDPQDLRTASREFSSNASEVKKLTGEMINLINETASAWKGNASQSYIRKFDELQADMNKMDKMIEEHITDLEKMAGVYETAESENAAMANKLETSVIS